jgi:D-alanyl-lipoteichoic acid acyltransferase DltB (MBOAT superfamily)
MLFNSPQFIFLFLPVTLFVFFQIGRRGYFQLAILWLVAASLFFYSWWNPVYLGLLIFSLLFNYAVGSALSQRFTIPINQKLLLSLGIAINIALIAYYKYANFFVDTVNDLSGTAFNLKTIILPLGISFFTFQQVAYLVDAYRGETKEYNFLNYCLFVTFFPQLIAGPIVHHKEVLPQFTQRAIYQFNQEDMAVGITIFSMGLFKKVMFADSVAVYATPVFNAATQGVPITFFEAWVGALAYSLQLYFDFSGYSDMAIGAARMFGIKLPVNFNSPYKAVNISDFWRRWHITLSNFLRDYLYIPLGGNRKGELQRNTNLMITMLLGGLWHGAGWNFVFWGGLHGFGLVVNHQWRSFRKSLGHDLKKSHWWSRGLSCFVTFIFVVVAWVFFRAESMAPAIAILKAMSGANSISLPSSLSTKLAFLQSWGVQFDGLMLNLKASSTEVILWIGSLLLVTWFTPNTQQWLSQYKPVLNQPSVGTSSGWGDRLWQKLQWHPTSLTSFLISLVTFFTLLKVLSVTHSEFLYFDF